MGEGFPIRRFLCAGHGTFYSMKFYVKTHISTAKRRKSGVEVRAARLSPTHNINVPAICFCGEIASYNLPLQQDKPQSALRFVFTKEIDITYRHKNFAAIIAQSAMMAEWLLKQPSPIAYFLSNPIDILPANSIDKRIVVCYCIWGYKSAVRSRLSPPPGTGKARFDSLKTSFFVFPH